MAYLQENNSENLAARITNKGRKKIAQGNFNISYFQIGDSEYDYGFSMFDGETNPAQKVLMPFDKDSQVKYPYKVSESSLTGTTYGVPIQFSETNTIRNDVDPAGYVSGYLAYDEDLCTGSTVICSWNQIDISALDGTKFLVVNSGSTFNNTELITIYRGVLGINNIIMSGATSLVYRIVGITGNTLELDRETPDLSSLSPLEVTVISNDCVEADSWDLNIVWSIKPAGLDYPTEDEYLSGYTSNIYVSSKEYFGYNTSSGQTSNNGTTITNSFGDVVIVPPEEQHSLAILHYSKASDILIDPDRTFKYEDYIDHSSQGKDYFEIYIPFILYERNTGTTIGATFYMDNEDKYINSSAIDTRTNQMKFRYLLDIKYPVDEEDRKKHTVGKIFVNHKVIVFDDQEIVAVLDYKSNRRYTLPIPRIAAVPMDIDCGIVSPVSSPSATPSISVSPSVTPSISISNTPGVSQSVTPSISISNTPVVSSSVTPSITPSYEIYAGWTDDGQLTFTGLTTQTVSVTVLIYTQANNSAESGYSVGSSSCSLTMYKNLALEKQATRSVLGCTGPCSTSDSGYEAPYTVTGIVSGTTVNLSASGDCDSSDYPHNYRDIYSRATVEITSVTVTSGFGTGHIGYNNLWVHEYEYPGCAVEEYASHTTPASPSVTPSITPSISKTPTPTPSIQT